MKNVNDNDIGLFPPESNNKIFINRSYLFDNILFISLKMTFLLLLRVILHYFFSESECSQEYLLMSH